MELQQQYIEQAINLHNNNPVVDAHLDLAAELVYRVRNGEMNPLRSDPGGSGVYGSADL